jgi:hypothetical protein
VSASPVDSTSTPVIFIRRGRTPDAAILATTASQKNHRPPGDDFSVKGPAGDSRLSPPKSTVRNTRGAAGVLYVVVLDWSTVEFGVCSCGVSSEIKVVAQPSINCMFLTFCFKPDTPIYHLTNEHYMSCLEYPSWHLSGSPCLSIPLLVIGVVEVAYMQYHVSMPHLNMNL